MMGDDLPVGTEKSVIYHWGRRKVVNPPDKAEKIYHFSTSPVVSESPPVNRPFCLDVEGDADDIRRPIHKNYPTGH